MKQYWLTDLGQSLELVPDDGGAPRVIGRYGVWEAHNGKAQCVDCSEDLDALRAKYGLAADTPVHPIMPRARMPQDGAEKQRATYPSR